MKSEVTMHDDHLQLTRVFDAPRHLVFGMWADPRKMERWSGCKEMTSCSVTMDFRVGGSFRQTMQLAVHGQTCEFVIAGTYREITEPSRIIYDALFGDAPTRVTVDFLEHPQGTKLVLTHEGCPNDTFRDNVSRGTLESFDAIDALLTTDATVTPR
jgi:uncharacterized protein YndB with AHSA1/START domain